MIGQRRNSRSWRGSTKWFDSAQFNVPGLTRLRRGVVSEEGRTRIAISASVRGREKRLKDVLAPDFTPIKPKGAA